MCDWGSAVLVAGPDGAPGRQLSRAGVGEFPTWTLKLLGMCCCAYLGCAVAFLTLPGGLKIYFLVKEREPGKKNLL